MIPFPCYIFDLDGTLFDISHRKHHIEGEKKDWRAFFAGCKDDKPIQHMVDLCITLSKTHLILFASGRSTECRHQTILSMREAGLTVVNNLYMRQEGDHRPDEVLKKEILERIIAEGYRPIMAFDDRDKVVKMWRENGVPCAQVAEGDF